MSEFSRRGFGGALGAGAAASLALGATPASAAVRQPPFPRNFKWGCATASYQIEGAVHEDGRGETIWDVFSHTPGKVANGDTGDVATDSYHRYAEDTQLLKNMGVSTYRMSLAWSRIIPQGRGQVNQAGLDHYKRVIDNLLENGITPYVTLFHWDLPTGLEGGWQNRDTANAFGEYAALVGRSLGDRVHNFMTTNEIRCFTDLGYNVGVHAPGLRLDPKGANQVRHHGILAHGLGAQALRANAPRGTKIGLAENTDMFVPVIETAEHIEAAKKAFRIGNAPFLTAIMEGRYIDEYLEQVGANAPVVQSGDFDAIKTPLDFVALNCYSGTNVRASDGPNGYTVIPHIANGSPRMSSPWLYIQPESIYWGTRFTKELWNPKSMFISENGCSAEDSMQNGRVDDTDRVMYLRAYLTQLSRAVAEGVPVNGYFLWSLMDNFEWADGYGKRFGVHWVDFETQQRTPKLSAIWYREVIKAKKVL